MASGFMKVCRCGNVLHNEKWERIEMSFSDVMKVVIPKSEKEDRNIIIIKSAQCAECAHIAEQQLANSS
jgi:acetone carboxylase gamma subunit